MSSNFQIRESLGVEKGGRVLQDHEFNRITLLRYLNEESRRNKIKQQQENAVLFAEILVETGNLEYARKEAGLSISKAEHYVHFLNNTAVARGLPLVYTCEKLKERERKTEILKDTLQKTGNFDYARKKAGLSASKADHYLNLLSDAAERGEQYLHAAKPKSKNLVNAKLCAEQVKYIKYLITKYSLKKVAAMYGVSASTMNLIRNGMIWKDVKPAIVNESPVLWINQYLCIK